MSILESTKNFLSPDGMAIVPRQSAISHWRAPTYRVHPGVYTSRAMALSLLKFGSKRDLRSEFRCNIKLLNENEVLEGIEFPVSTLFTTQYVRTLPLTDCICFQCDSSTTNSEKPRVNFYWTIVSSTFTLKRQISSVYDSPTPMTKR